MRTLKTLLATLATPIMLATAASAHPGHTAVVEKSEIDSGWGFRETFKVNPGPSSSPGVGSSR